MKRLFIVLFAFPVFVKAQNNPLVAEGVSPALYVIHTVAPKENYYSIGRIYNISPKEIAPFNNMELEKGLSLNQVIKIPLSPANFLQEGNAGVDEVLVPVYHTVKDKEGLYRISTNYNKVPVELLVKWNNLKSSAAPNGTNLIIGYLKVKKELSSLASMAKTKPADDVAKAVAVSKPVAEKPVEKVVEKTVEATAPVKETAVVPEPVKKTTEPVVVKEQPPVKSIATPASGKTFNGGAFKPDFERQSKSNKMASESGEAAVFRSTSGWDDGKYYCLHNSSSPGTIIRITNSSTGKEIYAKVLDGIPDMKQNTGLVIRLSNAAANELGAGDAKFFCTLSYSK